MQQPARFILIIAIIVLQALTILAILFSYQRHTEQILSEHTAEILANMLDNVNDNVVGYLSSAEQIARLTRELVLDGVLDPYDNDALEQYFFNQLKIADNVYSVYLGRDDGSFVIVGRAGPNDEAFYTKIIQTAPVRRVTRVLYDRFLNETDRFDILDDYDPRQRVWYVLAEDTTLPMWSDPYIFFASQIPGITTSVEVSDTQRNPLGVIGVDIKLLGLSEFIQTIPISSQGSAVIYTDKGILVASQSFNNRNFADNQLPSVQDGAPWYIQQMLQVEPIAVDEATHRAHYIFPERNHVSRQHHGMEQPFVIDSQAETLWHIAAEAPLEDFISGIRDYYRQSVQLAIGIAFFALVATFLVLMFGLNRPWQNLQRRATIDHLTQIMNRDEFIRQAENIRTRMMQHGKKAVVAVLDLDGFKPVNDTYGHAVGDELLYIFAQRLKNSVGEGNIVGRLGGDEFALLLQDVTAENAVSSLEEIRQFVTKDSIITSVSDHKLGATVGVSQLLIRHSIEESLHIADTALLEGKATVKNQTYFANALHDDVHFIRFLRD